MEKLNHSKYQRNYFLPPTAEHSWTQKDHIENAPIWCSVDLRDGNQSILAPLSVEQKIQYFNMLVKMGFHEIEVGFPAASDTEFSFIRKLIEENLIPEDVTIQVLTSSREDLVRKTFAALSGVKQAIVHVYNSTSPAWREQVFDKDKNEVMQMATDGARLVQTLAATTPGSFILEYSPESFTATEPEYALAVCNAVLDTWQPTAEKVIINLPATVELSMPHIYADQVEYISQNLHYRENVILSLHPHNDRGTAIAAAEMGLLAGAQRIEGTLFGNGERAGNVDLVTLAFNLYAQGVDPELNLDNISEICDFYEYTTDMPIEARHPYVGSLAFAAFSGMHQQAIAKGLAWREQHPQNKWNMPYLPIDPQDLGREYAGDVIRINSQSGKGGVAYVLKKHFGINLPNKMRESVSDISKYLADSEQQELMPQEIYDAFALHYLNLNEPYHLDNFDFARLDRNIMEATVQLTYNGQPLICRGTGNGRIDSVSNAIRNGCGIQFNIFSYEEHALSHGSDSSAMAYMGIQYDQNKIAWGAGMHPDIITASVYALLSAINNIPTK